MEYYFKKNFIIQLLIMYLCFFITSCASYFNIDKSKVNYPETTAKRSVTIIGIDSYEQNHEYIVELDYNYNYYRKKSFRQDQPYFNVDVNNKNYPIHMMHQFPLSLYEDRNSFFTILAQAKQFDKIYRIEGYPGSGIKLENTLNGNKKTIPHTIYKNYDYAYDFKFSENFFKDCGTDYIILITEDVKVERIINKNAEVFYEKDANCLPLLTTVPSCLTLGILPFVQNTKRHAAIFVYNQDGNLIGSRYFEEKGYMFSSSMLLPFLYSDNVKLNIIGPEVEKEFKKEVELTLYNKITDAIIEIIKTDK